MSYAKPAAGQFTHAMSLPSAGSAAPPLRVYFAGRWGRREELRIRRDAFQSFGVVVTSSWLDEAPHQNVPDDGSELPESPSTRAEIATRDLADLASADVVVAFTELPTSPYSRGGRHVELGVAIGLRKLVWIVGPRENVFCWLPQVRQFDDFDGLLGWYWERAGGCGKDHRFEWGGGLEWKGPSESEKAGGHWVSSEELLAAHRRHFDHPAGPTERKVLERGAAEEAAYRARLGAAVDRYTWKSDSCLLTGGSGNDSATGEITLEKILAAQDELKAFRVQRDAVSESIRKLLEPVPAIRGIEAASPICEAVRRCEANQSGHNEAKEGGGNG